MPVRNPSPAQPEIDLDRLDYPSDLVTIKHLRLLFPEEFRNLHGSREHRAFLDPSDNGISLAAMLKFERMLAQRTFDKILGREVNTGAVPDEDLLEHLEELYTNDFKIAQGPQHARQMIRDLQSAATEQAQQYLHGRRP